MRKLWLPRVDNSGFFPGYLRRLKTDPEIPFENRFQWRILDFPEVVRQHTILPNFLKNCMKLKELGHPGARPSRPL